MSIIPRLNRLLASDGHCFDVAIDHGFFNERTFLDNIEDMKRVISTFIEANPDAVQLSPGLAPLLQEIPGKARPSLVLRTDIANIYGQIIARLFVQPIDRGCGRAGACTRRGVCCRKLVSDAGSARVTCSMH